MQRQLTDQITTSRWRNWREQFSGVSSGVGGGGRGGGRGATHGVTVSTPAFLACQAATNAILCV